MGLFSRKARAVPEGLTTALLPGGQSIDVVGESHYQDALEQVAGGKTEESRDLEKWAVLLREPDNPYDGNAVAVFVTGLKVGYLSRPDAERYGVLIDELAARYGLRSACRASVRGGWRRLAPEGTVADEGSYGVVLALAAYEDLIGEYEVTACDDAKLLEEPPPIEPGVAAPPEPRPAKVAAASSATCVTCGSALREGAKFCGECGAELALPETANSCPQCSIAVRPGDRFCRECGARLPQLEDSDGSLPSRGVRARPGRA